MTGQSSNERPFDAAVDLQPCISAYCFTRLGADGIPGPAAYDSELNEIQNALTMIMIGFWVDSDPPCGLQ